MLIILGDYHTDRAASYFTSLPVVKSILGWLKRERERKIVEGGGSVCVWPKKYILADGGLWLRVKIDSTDCVEDRVNIYVSYSGMLALLLIKG